jgi:hypothetical protein
MNPDIIIPTHKSEIEITPLVGDVAGHSFGCKVIKTCKKQSAAANRNHGLDQATSDIVIMIDDDVCGFSLGWWRNLVAPLVEHEDIVFVSARLMDPDGRNGAMMFQGDITAELADVKQAPTACCAFRNDGTRFDNAFVGSGWEDTFFCECLKHKYPGGRVVINNAVQIVHMNEEKNQRENHEHNEAMFNNLMAELEAGRYRG